MDCRGGDTGHIRLTGKTEHSAIKCNRYGYEEKVVQEIQQLYFILKEKIFSLKKEIKQEEVELESQEGQIPSGSYLKPQQ